VSSGRQRIIQEMLSAQASPTFVEKLENVEKQLTDVREKILDARALEKSGECSEVLCSCVQVDARWVGSR